MIDADRLNAEFDLAAEHAQWEPLPPREPGDDYDDLRPEWNAGGNLPPATNSKPRRKPKHASADEKFPLGKMDPMDTARRYVNAECRDAAGVLTLRFYQGEAFRFDGTVYRAVPDDELKASIIRHVDRFASDITRSAVANILACVQAETILESRIESPFWIEDAPQHFGDPSQILVAQNGLINLQRFSDGLDDYLCPATPLYFNTNTLDYEFDPCPSLPKNWLEFLSQLWPDAPDCIDTLQQWAGYLLTADTRQQKILLMPGPKRSGKGTIGRVLRGLNGAENVAGPTLASLGTQFGLWPLLGKRVGIISDARLSRRTDSAIVTERMLSISGEDALTVDRKNLHLVTVKLPTRLMIFTNELPRLGDSSGALAGRMIVLPLTRSFYGQEDLSLTDRLLAELPGILLWAIEGWARLRDQGHFIQPNAGRELLTELEDLSSPISVFVRDRCCISPDNHVPVADLFAEWQRWCQNVGQHFPGTEQVFGRDLRAAVPGITVGQRRDGESRFREYRGIGIKTPF